MEYKLWPLKYKADIPRCNISTLAYEKICNQNYFCYKKLAKMCVLHFLIPTFLKQNLNNLTNKTSQTIVSSYNSIPALSPITRVFSKKVIWKWKARQFTIKFWYCFFYWGLSYFSFHTLLVNNKERLTIRATLPFLLFI